MRPVKHCAILATLAIALLVASTAVPFAAPARAQGVCCAQFGPPTISTVSGISASSGTQHIVITGSNFGGQDPYNGDSANILITDNTQNWNAGCSDRGKSDSYYASSCIYDTVTLNISKWTTDITEINDPSEIDIEGFTGDYGDCCSLYAGDSVTITIWNAWNAFPPDGPQPATYTLTVSACGPAQPTLQICSFTPPPSQIYNPGPPPPPVPPASRVNVPATPSNVNIVALGPSTLYITWTPNSYDEDGFDITRDQHYAPEGHVGAGTYSFVWNGLPAGSYICISVRAENSAGASPYTGWTCTTLPSH